MDSRRQTRGADRRWSSMMTATVLVAVLMMVVLVDFSAASSSRVLLQTAPAIHLDSGVQVRDISGPPSFGAYRRISQRSLMQNPDPGGESVQNGERIFPPPPP